MSNNLLVIAHGRDRRSLATEALARLGIERILPPGAAIGLKPNLVVVKPSSSGATTDPELAAGVLGYLHDHGWRDFTILESSGLGMDTEQAFRVSGYEKVAKEFGARLIDLKKDATEKVSAGGLEMEICQKALEADFLIDLPVLKAHCQAKLTCALKNLKGCIPDREKRRFHTLGLHQPIACLAKALPVALVVVDAVAGDLSFEEGGNPVPMDRVIAGLDPVMVDAYAAELIGYAPEEIEYIGLAAGLGVGRADPAQRRLLELGGEYKLLAGPAQGHAAVTLARYVEARAACSVCYGALLHALARMQASGLDPPKRKISIGQGFRGTAGAGPGIGDCAARLTPYLPGCPPGTREMVEFLKSAGS